MTFEVINSIYFWLARSIFGAIFLGATWVVWSQELRTIVRYDRCDNADRCEKCVGGGAIANAQYADAMMV